MDINEILAKAAALGASDVHLKQGLVPVVRVHGELYPLDMQMKRLTGEDIKNICTSILPVHQQKLLENRREIDTSYGVSGLGRYRVNIFRQRGSLRLVIRAIRDKVPTLEELTLPKILEKIANYERGLILVTGATGSGKSTTMASLVDHINRTRNRHILTIEDPIEYLIQDRKSLITQRELGSDTESFASALRAGLRQDPDVILIGEMRDKETIETAILAAETGHLVISTLHTSDAHETINRILTCFEPSQQPQMRLQLSTVLQAVISQRLARKHDGSGIIPAVEIMLGTTRIREMIVKPDRTSDIPVAIEEGFVSYGMQSFDQSLMDLLSKQLITLQEAMSLSTRPEDFELRYKGVTSSDGKRWDNFDKNNGSQGWSQVEDLEVDRIVSPVEPSEDSKMLAKKKGTPVKKAR